MKKTGGAISLQWTEPHDTGGLPITKYTLFFRKSGLSAEWTKVSEETERFVTVKSLTAETYYNFKVVPTASSSDPAFSKVGKDKQETFSTSTMTLPASNELRCIPTVLHKTGGMLHLKWLNPLDTGGGGISGYSLILASDRDPLTTLKASDLNGIVSL